MMERSDGTYTTRSQANYALTDRRNRWSAGQVLQCKEGAFCEPLPEEMVDRAMPFGPRYVPLEQLEDQAESIRPSAKRTKAIEHRDRLDAAGRIKSLKQVQSELADQQAAIDTEISELLGHVDEGH